MYEFTHGGMWFDWAKLDGTSKRLARWSLISSGVAALPVGVVAGEAGYRFGYALASGAPATLQATVPPWAAIWVVVFMLVSGVLWWRMSRRQDEMFNRIQNWALGAGSGGSAVLLTCWAFLAMTGLVPWASPMATIMIFSCAIVVAWFIAYRRWA